MSEGSDGPWELPKGWAWVPFADVARVASNLVSPFDYPDLPHIAPNHIESETGRLLPFATVAEDGVKSPKHLFSSGHVLYSKIRPYLAKVVMAKFDGLCSADMYPISTEIDAGFLAFWLRSPAFTGLAAKHQGRSVLPKINKEALAKLPVPVPPLDEQRRIVAMLEEQLSRLDAAIGNAAHAMNSAETLIRSVKAKAVRDLVSKFPTVRLADELSEPLRNGHSARAEVGGMIRTLTLTAVTKGIFDDAHTKMTAADPDRVAKLWLKRGDILVQRSNTPDLVGTSALYEGPDDWAIFPDLLIRVRTSARLDAHFAQLVLSAPQTRHYYRSQAKGLAGSMPKIDQETILNTPIPLPDLEVQRQTLHKVARVIERARYATTTGEVYRAKSAALRRSLLTEAFAGRLVPQDPADEPADGLLARIRAEREATGATKSRRRRTRRAPVRRPSDVPPPARSDAPSLSAATQPTLDLEMPS
ncbi:restriction endonuclease subunit S [Streptomyces rochei]|uniref:restriction endonuclease subunit S n=1 Tax=Streptomyces rochei TaxID=1928 RepID=UPI00339E8F0D